MQQQRLLSALLSLAMMPGAAAVADEVVDGRFGPGALYRLVRPTNWNGTLLVYAHGFVSAGEPVALPAEADLLVSLLAPQGVALAYSSFSENGWAVKDGSQRTHQLKGIFRSKFGRPIRTYIGGASMGGLIAIMLTETYPGDYVGALAACAVAGGSQAQFDYLGHARALFDFFYPGVLPGDASDLPADIDVESQIVLPALVAMGATGAGDPTGAFAIASIEQTPVPYAGPEELVESIVTALAGNAGLPDLLQRTHGHPFFDNSDTQYAGALLPPLLQQINEGVSRFSASPSALAYFDHYYAPSGDLRIPMLMLFTSRDPVVPGFHQSSYLEAVTADGSSDLLVQREIQRYGHCVFEPGELAAAFADLVAWVEFGIKPDP